MKYCFPQLRDSLSRLQVFNVIRSALVKRGHEIVDDITESDAVLFSACDVVETRHLRSLRKSTSKPIICGGQYAINYYSAKLYSDIVWLGHVYDFADMKSLDDIASSQHAYTGVDKPLKLSKRICWDEIPITQMAPHKCYYMGGVGCKNKCKFCFTSWTNPHQVNSKKAIAAAADVCRKKGIHLMVASNEYDYDADARTKDMLLVDYISMRVSGLLVRCGIEFASEDTRQKMGKRITRDQIYAALQKTNLDNIALRLFHITGYEPIGEWERYIDDMCWMLDKVKNKKIIQLEFNNLQYQNFTPLYKERKSINPDNYIDIRTTKRWYDKLRQYSKHVLVGAPSPFIHVAARMGVELAKNIEQSEYWLHVMNNREKHTPEEAYNSLFSTGVFDTPHMMINHATGEFVSRAVVQS